MDHFLTPQGGLSFLEASSLGILGATQWAVKQGSPVQWGENKQKAKFTLLGVSHFQYRVSDYLELTNSQTQSSLRNGQDQAWYMESKYQNRLVATDG